MNARDMHAEMARWTENVTEPDLAAELSRMKEAGLYRGEIYTVITDFGLRRMWVKDHVDRYFISGDRVLRGLLALGVPREKISMTGIPVSRKFASLKREGRNFSKKRLSFL